MRIESPFTLKLDALLKTYPAKWEASKASLIDVHVFLETALQFGFHFREDQFNEVINITEAYKAILKHTLPESQLEKLIKPMYNLTYTFAKALSHRTNINDVYRELTKTQPLFLVTGYDKKSGLLIVEYEQRGHIHHLS